MWITLLPSSVLLVFCFPSSSLSEINANTWSSQILIFSVPVHTLVGSSTKLHKQTHWSHDTLEVSKWTKCYLLPRVFMLSSLAFSSTLQSTYFKYFCYPWTLPNPSSLSKWPSFLLYRERQTQAEGNYFNSLQLCLLFFQFLLIKRYQLPRTPSHRDLDPATAIALGTSLCLSSLFFLLYFFSGPVI